MFANLKKKIEAESVVTEPAVASDSGHPAKNYSSFASLGKQQSDTNSGDEVQGSSRGQARSGNASDTNSSDLRARYLQLEKAYENYRTKTGGLLSKKDSHINRLQARIDTLESRVTELQQGGNLHSLLAERDALQQRGEQIEAAYAREKDTWWSGTVPWAALLADEQSARRLEVDTLQEKVRELTEQLQRPSPPCDQCPVEARARQAAEAALAAEQTKSATLSSQLSYAKQDCHRLQQEIDHMQSAQSKLAAAALDQADVQCEIRVTSLSNELEHLCEVLERTDTDRHMLRGDVAEKERAIDQLKGRLKQAEATANRLQGVIEGLREELERRSSACDLQTATEIDHAAFSTDVPETSDQDSFKEISRPSFDAGRPSEAEIENVKLKSELQNLKSNSDRVKQQLESAEAELRSLGSEQTRGALKQLQCNIAELESAVSNRDATIEAQRGRLNELDNKLRRQLSNAAAMNAHNDLYRAAGFGGSSVSLVEHGGNMVDINFEYLRHVMLRFMTATDYEALTLVRAVSAILRLSKAEEEILRKTLEWKQQWLPISSKPKLK